MSRMSVISNGKITYKLANILSIFGFLLMFFAYFTDEKFDGVEFFNFRINEIAWISAIIFFSIAALIILRIAYTDK